MTNPSQPQIPPITIPSLSGWPAVALYFFLGAGGGGALASSVGPPTKSLSEKVVRLETQLEFLSKQIQALTTQLEGCRNVTAN